MICYKYSEEDLLSIAMKNLHMVKFLQDKELLEVLIRDFGLNVNLRSDRFYNTLLYESLKTHDESLIEFFISKGACVNASLNGYPKENEKEQSYGDMSILDCNCDNYELIKKHGGISFAKLPKETKEETIKLLDCTKVASKEKNIVRTKGQIELILQMVSEETKKMLLNFLYKCEEIDSKDILNNKKETTADLL